MDDLTTSVKQQHTVPRFLLSYFGHGKNKKKRQVWVYDKQSEKEFKQSVKDASTRNAFYNLSDSDENLSLEPILGQFETAAAPVIDKIITGRSLGALTGGERVTLAKFVAVQRARSYGELLRIDDMIESFTKKLISLGGSEDDIQRQFGDEADRKNFFLQMILSQIEFYEQFLSLDWILYETDMTNPFYISDSPVSLHNDIDMGPYGNLGLAVKGIQVHLPLSSTLTLAFTCPSISAPAIRAKDQLELILRIDRTTYLRSDQPSLLLDHGYAYELGVPIKVPSENVRFLNHLQVRHAERFVYCEKPNFALVSEMINQSEHFRYGMRMRMS